MLEQISVFPVSFWAVVFLLGVGGANAARRIRNGSGIPMLAVLGTTAVWYVGDAVYNDYVNTHMWLFAPGILNDAWWQVAWFLIAFIFLAPRLHRRFNKSYLRRTGAMFRILEAGVASPALQRQLERLFYLCMVVWLVLVVFAAIRLGEDLIYYFFPFLGYRADPWARSRVGGTLDFVLSFAGYLQVFVGGSLGVVAALVKNRRIRYLALLGCLLTWPYYIFHRTRNTMLATMMPAVLAWTFLRLRGSLGKKGIVLLGFLLVLHLWFSFVITHRTDGSIASVFAERGFTVDPDERVAHLGINMFEELCWINTFLQDGSYAPNWGERYFQELVNPIPRALWAGKPLLGIDYAIARGHGGAHPDEAGVIASISTGFIGQGVVNFGRFLGPPVVSFLMALWVTALARLDLRGGAHVPLYVLGVILTFNLGRDITLLTLYPFFFGRLLVWWAGLEKNRKTLGKIIWPAKSRAYRRRPA